MQDFPENKAKETLKRQQALANSNQDVNEQQLDELSNIGKLIDKLQKSVDKQDTFKEKSKQGNSILKETLQMATDMRDTKASGITNITSELSLASLDMLEKIANDSQTATYKEQKELKHELKKMTEFISSAVKDEDEKKALLKLKDEIALGVEKNTSVLQAFGGKITDTLTSKALPFISGAIAGVFSDSPIIGIAAGLITDFAQKKIEQRKEKIRARKESALVRLSALQEEHARKSAELLASDEPTSQEEKVVEELKLDIDNLELFMKGFFDELVVMAGEFISGFMSELYKIGIEQGWDKQENANITTVEPLSQESNSKVSLGSDYAEISAEYLDAILSTNDDIHDTLKSYISTTMRGAEERRRESAFERKELISAIEGLKGSGGLGSKDDEDGGIGSKIMEWATGLLSGLGIGKIFKKIGAIFVGIKKGASRILKFATKIFAPLTAITSIFNGITKGMDKFKETGSIFEGVAAGVMGAADTIISAFTFGFLDLDKISGFLRDIIPTGLSDAVFGGIDWIIDKISGAWDLAKGLFGGIKDIVMAPFKAISYFFNTSWSDMFSDAANFMTDLKESIFQWIASVVPDFIPDAVIPNSILKYKSKKSAMDVAEQEYIDFNKDRTTYSKQDTIEAVKLRKKFEQAQLDYLEDEFKKTGDKSLLSNIEEAKFKIRKSEDSIANMSKSPEQLKNERLLAEGKRPDGTSFFDNPINVDAAVKRTQAMSSDSIISGKDLPKNTKTQIHKVIQQEKENMTSAVISGKDLPKNTKTQIHKVIQQEKEKLQANENKKSAPMVNSVNSSSNVVNNNSSTHVTKDVFNRDPSIMQPILN